MSKRSVFLGSIRAAEGSPGRGKTLGALRSATCCVCGLVFHRPPSHLARIKSQPTCGAACRIEARKIRVAQTCVVCGAEFFVTPANVGRVTTCSERCHRFRKIRNTGDLATRLEAIAAIKEARDAAAQCAGCAGAFGEETRCVEGLVFTLADDGVTVLVSGVPSVYCRPCHLTNASAVRWPGLSTIETDNP